MNSVQYEVDMLLNIGIALSKEKNRNQLLNMILTESMNISNCDAGTLYIRKENVLQFKIMKTISMGVDQGADGEEITLPPVPIREENICAYTAIHKTPVNIPDVYTNDLFDFSGPRRYDSMTGYRTGSMLAVPLINQAEEVVGVLQLMNAKDKEGNTCPFEKEWEQIIFSLASQAAIAISNMQYLAELKEQMWSFTEAMAEAIDQRTAYNASHIRMVAKYAGKMADYINFLHDQGEEEEYFDEQRREQLVMSALLHDIGKMVVPTKVMNKATRLGDGEESLLNRLEMFKLKYQILYLEQKLSHEIYEAKVQELDHILELVNEVNRAGFVPDDIMESMKASFELVYETEDEKIPYFTEKEKTALSIRKGTLTEEERRIMESHVDMTEKILNKVHFISYFQDSAMWAIQHHECLNGKGYPKGLKEEELPLESRILAVADICDALLATDRPYKKPLPKEKVFAILQDMAKGGTIDGKLVDYMEACIDR